MGCTLLRHFVFLLQIIWERRYLILRLFPQVIRLLLLLFFKAVSGRKLSYALVLGYWSNQPELTINVTVFTRYPFNEGVTDIVGDFTSVILLRVNLLGRSDFWKLASEIQNQLMDALEHRHYDGMNVIRKIAEQAEMKEQAVMPVVFTSLLFSMEEGDIVTIEDLGEVKMGVSQTSQVYLDYQVMETKEGLLITWDYIKELFTPNMISTMFKQYINIVESLSKNVISMPHLTDVQMAYLLGRNDEFDLGGISTHGYYEVLTKLDIKKLEKSLNRTIKEQSMFRTVFSKSGMQRVLKYVPEYSITVEDLSLCSKKEQQEKILMERSRMSHYVFDVEKWPLFEFKAFKINSQEYYLFIGIDLLIADGSSMRILVRELKREYDYEATSSMQQKFDYKDYVHALEEFKNSDIYMEDKGYWTDRIDLLAPAPELPLKKELSEVKNPHFKRQQEIINNNIWENIKKEARNREITTSALLCSVYAAVLGYWSNQKDLTINVTVFTRYPFNPNVNNIIGDFTSVILLDVKLGEMSNLWDLAQRVQKQMMDALEHRHYDGINVIRELAKRKNMQQQAIMPVVFTSLLFSIDSEDNATINDLGEIKMGVSQTSQVYLDYQVMETKEGLSITWDYIEELFDEEVIGTMFLQYINALKNLDKPYSELLRPAKDDEAIIQKYNDTQCDIEETTIQREFKKVASKYPEHVIVSDIEGEMTCVELDKKSNQIAHYLISSGVKSGDIIGVMGKRKKETIMNIVGILKAGAAYVAIDPTYPKERQEYILSNSGSAYLLEPEFYETYNINQYSDTALDITYHPEDIAYLIYTSGSTGVPKGVVITQSAVMNTVLDINQKFSIDNTDKIIGLSSMCFDLSVYDIFGSLSTGAKLVEIEDIHDISYLERIVEKEGITVWNSVPAIMEMFLNGIGNERLFPTINTVLLSGDWIPVNMPNAIKKVCENARVVSLGGATEGSIWSIYYPVDYVDPEWKSIPYGKPLANQTYYVLNYEGRECPVGVSGELYIGGKGVAQGYFKDH